MLTRTVSISSSVNRANIDVPPSLCSSTTRPSIIRTIRSMRRPTAMSWVTTTNVKPRWTLRSRISATVSFGPVAVEVAGRFVGPHDRGIVHQRPRDRDPLALTAGELVGNVLAALAEADELRARRARVCAPRASEPGRPRAAARRSRPRSAPASGCRTGRRSPCAGRDSRCARDPTSTRATGPRCARHRRRWSRGPKCSSAGSSSRSRSGP